MSKFKKGDMVICNGLTKTNVIAVIDTRDMERDGFADEGYFVKRLSSKGVESYFYDFEMRLATEMERALYG